MSQPTGSTDTSMDRRAEALSRLWGVDGVGQTAWEQARKVVQEYQDVLMDDYAARWFARAIKSKVEDLEATDSSDIVKSMVRDSLIEKWSLLQRCREVGITKAFDEKGGRLYDDWKWSFANFASLSERGGSWAFVKDLLHNTFPQLLTMEAYGHLGVAPWDGSINPLGSITVGELLKRTHLQGIDAAFEDLVEFGTDVPVTIRTALRAALEATEQYDDSGDRISLDAAIEHWELVVTDTSFSASSIHTQRKYLVEAGDAYEYRYQERGAVSDLDRAIALWNQAAEQSARPEFLYYLGYSYERRYRSTASPDSSAGAGESPSSLDLAIEYYDRAYDRADELYGGILPAPVDESPDGFQEVLWKRKQRARYRNAAGLALQERYRANGVASDLEAAVLRCRQATEIAEKDKLYAPDLYDDLGQVLVHRFVATESRDDAQAAIRAYEQALERYSKATPVLALEAANHLGFLLYYLGEISRARAALETAHNWAQDARLEQSSQLARQQLSDLTTVLYGVLVACCLREGDVESAFQYAAAAKGRSFVDALMAARVGLDTLLELQSIAAEDLDPYLRLREEIDTVKALIHQQVAPLPPGEEPDLRRSETSLYGQLAGLRHQEKILWDNLVSRYKFLAAVADAPPMTAVDARRLSRDLDSTLVEYYHHQEGWCAFVVTADQVMCRSLPGVNEDLLNDLATWVQDISEHDQRDTGQDVLTRWYDAVVSPLRSDLLGAKTSIIAPYGPMHALPFCAGVDLESSQCVIDEFSIGFAPSLSALGRIWQRDDEVRPQGHPVSRVLGVAYPGPPGPFHLANTSQEVAAVLECFDGAQATALLDERATPDGVIAHTPGQDVIHLSCHALFDPRYPAQSGLSLSGGWLTARRIITELNLSSASLFTMSACSTAKSDVSAGDELEGLTQAAMMAGAPTVVASLWPVDDAATRVLLTSFYRHVTSGSPPIHAMRAAMRHLREGQADRWNHPYYWSGFVVSGLGHRPLGPPIEIR